MRTERGTLRVPSAAECLFAVTIGALGAQGRGVRAEREDAGLPRTYRSLAMRPQVVAAIEYRGDGSSALPGRGAVSRAVTVLYHYLRCRGIAAQIYASASSGTHSWRMRWWEYRGEPINDVPEHVRIFTAFGRGGPAGGAARMFAVVRLRGGPPPMLVPGRGAGRRGVAPGPRAALGDDGRDRGRGGRSMVRVRRGLCVWGR